MQMLTATKETKGALYIVKLNGMVDDEANFDSAVGPVPKGDVAIVCSQVTRINSVGVKAWIKFWTKAKDQGAKLKFIDCSPPIVQQINMVFNFTCGGQVVSLQASFACEKCENTFLKSLEANEVKRLNFKIPNQKCPKCGGEAEFDDLPKMYFKFLTAPGR